MQALLDLLEHGQSYWLDNLTRGMIRSGELEHRVRDEGLRGVTSNPAIFEKALSGSTDYSEVLDELAGHCRDENARAAIIWPFRRPEGTLFW